jgi:hypothetical protein
VRAGRSSAARAAASRSRSAAVSNSSATAPPLGSGVSGKYRSKTRSKRARCCSLWSRVAASASRIRSRSVNPTASRARPASTLSPVPMEKPWSRSACTRPVSRSVTPADGGLTPRPGRAWPPPSGCRPDA